MTKNLYGGSPQDPTKVNVYFKIESKSPQEGQELSESMEEWEREVDILGSPDNTIQLLIPTSETYTNFVENLLESIAKADLKKLTDSTTITNLKYIIKQTVGNNYKLYIKSIHLGGLMINEENYKKDIDISDDSILLVTFSTQREDRIIFEDRMIGYESKNNKSIMNTILKDTPECEDKIFRYYVTPPWYPNWSEYYIEYKGTNVKIFDYNTFSITLTPDLLKGNYAKYLSAKKQDTYTQTLNLKFKKVKKYEVLFEAVENIGHVRAQTPRLPWHDAKFNRYYLLMAAEDIKFIDSDVVKNHDAWLFETYGANPDVYRSDWVEYAERGYVDWYNEYVRHKYLLELSKERCLGWVI